MRNYTSCTISTDLLFSCLFFRTTLNFESSSPVQMQNRLCSSQYVNCFQNQFPLTHFRLHNVSVLCLYPEIIIQSNSCCTLTLVIVRFILFGKRWKCQTLLTNNKDLKVFNVRPDLYKPLLASYIQVVLLFSLKVISEQAVMYLLKKYVKNFQNLKRPNFSRALLWFLLAVA